jgi:hypothetical protein
LDSIRWREIFSILNQDSEKLTEKLCLSGGSAFFILDGITMRNPHRSRNRTPRRPNASLERDLGTQSLLGRTSGRQPEVKVFFI